MVPSLVTPTPSARRLFDWLVEPGRLDGRLRYRLPSGPTLLIDADNRVYHGPAALKPLAKPGSIASSLSRLSAWSAARSAVSSSSTAKVAPAQRTPSSSGLT